jgi:TetR/AcrR family transcriptional repressor of nem operon
MRLSKQQTAENHRRIVEAATRLFQQYGFDRVGVAELMREAGFTHGGFYNHFESKEALAAEACEHVFARANAALADRLRTRNASALQAYIAEYLAPDRVNAPNDDVTLATLVADASRQSPQVQSTFAAGIEATLGTLTGYLAGRAAASTRIALRAARRQAVQRLSALVGAWVLARAVSRARPELSKEILAANSDNRTQGFGSRTERRTSRTVGRASTTPRSRR